VIGDVIVGVVATLVATEATDFLPWISIRLVRWAARHLYTSDVELAKDRAEEWEAVIKESLPTNISKLLFGLGFSSAALYRITARHIPVDLATAREAIGSLRFISWIRNSGRTREHAGMLAEQALINLSRDRILSQELLGLRIQVWRVSRWRQILYKLRPNSVSGGHSAEKDKWAMRFSIRQLTSTGLTKEYKSANIKFREGMGLVGLCLADNDRSSIVSLDIAPRSKPGSEWGNHSSEVTQKMSCEETRVLAAQYFQALSTVIQDPDSGRAIGCVTVSARNTPSANLDLKTDEVIHSGMSTLAATLSAILS
jgi:hypothetical protein